MGFAALSPSYQPNFRVSAGAAGRTWCNARRADCRWRVSLRGAGAAPPCLHGFSANFAYDGSIRRPAPTLRIFMWEYPRTIIALRYDFVLTVALDQPACG